MSLKSVVQDAEVLTLYGHSGRRFPLYGDTVAGGGSMRPTDVAVETRTPKGVRRRPASRGGGTGPGPRPRE